MPEQTALQQAKAARARFGVSGSPVTATKAFRKEMPFDHGHIKTESWILFTPAKTRLHLNTYNGQLGRNVNVDTFTHPIPEDQKTLRQILRGYDEVPVSECPIAVPA